MTKRGRGRPRKPIDFTPVRYRKATALDLDAINTIARQYNDELAFVSKNKIMKAILSRQAHVADLEGTIVGFVIFHKRRDGWCTIYDIAVNKEHTRRGVGAMLLYSVPFPIQLKVTEDNTRAINFYRRIGMQIEGVEDGKHRKLFLFRLHRLPIYCAGGNPRYADLAMRAKVPYGTAQGERPSIQPYMLDVEFLPEKQNWQDFLDKVKAFRPIQVTVTDFTHPDQRRQLYSQIRDLKKLGVLKIVCVPKFEGAIQMIPRFCIIGISVPTRSKKFAGYTLTPQDLTDLQGRTVHLLGGSYKRQAEHLELLSQAGIKVISTDANFFQKCATYAKYLNRQGTLTEQPKDKELRDYDYYESIYVSLLNYKSLITDPSK